MSPKFFLILTAFALVAGRAFGAMPALADGEVLTYKVGWKVLTGAGEIQISAASVVEEARPVLKVTTTTRTAGLARVLFEFKASAVAAFDAVTGRLLTYSETSTSDRKKTHANVAFDYGKSTARYENVVEPAKSATLTMPQGEPVDLIMSLVQTRTWDLKPGEKRNALVLFDDEFYELTVHAITYETIQTRFGNLKTLVLEPRMDRVEPKGMFKRGQSVRVWISQDERRLPVKFTVDLKVGGAGTATLTAYQPPKASAATTK